MARNVMVNGHFYAQRSDGNEFVEIHNSAEFVFTTRQVETAKLVVNTTAEGVPLGKISGIKILKTAFGMGLLESKLLWELGESWAKGYINIPTEE